MGSNHSKMSKVKKNIRPLNIKTHKRVQSSNSIYSDHSFYEVDEKPLIVNDELHINLSPQNVTIIFTIFVIANTTQFEYKKVLFHGRYEPIVEIMSEQILYPMSLLSHIPVKDGILHISRDSDTHMRILERQCNKMWFIEDSNLTILGYPTLPIPWLFWITDQNTWSIGIY